MATVRSKLLLALSSTQYDQARCAGPKVCSICAVLPQLELKTLCRTHPVWQVDHALLSDELQHAAVRGAPALPPRDVEDHGVLHVHGRCAECCEKDVRRCTFEVQGSALAETASTPFRMKSRAGTGTSTMQRLELSGASQQSLRLRRIGCPAPSGLRARRQFRQGGSRPHAAVAAECYLLVCRPDAYLDVQCLTSSKPAFVPVLVGRQGTGRSLRGARAPRMPSSNVCGGRIAWRFPEMLIGAKQQRKRSKSPHIVGPVPKVARRPCHRSPHPACR